MARFYLQTMSGLSAANFRQAAGYLWQPVSAPPPHFGVACILKTLQWVAWAVQWQEQPLLAQYSLEAPFLFGLLLL